MIANGSTRSGNPRTVFAAGRSERPSVVMAAPSPNARAASRRFCTAGQIEPPAPAPARQVSAGPHRFRSRDGFEILVGRSNEENDELTLRIARSHDLFFHVLGFPGSHVIVRAQKGKSVPLETLLDAAVVAVHYSKARDHGRAEVSYTPRKYVRKPRGARPGLVTVERSQTLFVGRDEARLRRVLDTAEPGRADVRQNG